MNADMNSYIMMYCRDPMRSIVETPVVLLHDETKHSAAILQRPDGCARSRKWSLTAVDGGDATVDDENEMFDELHAAVYT